MRAAKECKPQPPWTFTLAQFALALNLTAALLSIWLSEKKLAGLTILTNYDPYPKLYAQCVMPIPAIFVAMLWAMIRRNESTGKIERATASSLLIVLSSISLLSYTVIFWLTKLSS